MVLTGFSMNGLAGGEQKIRSKAPSTAEFAVFHQEPVACSQARMS